MSKRQHGQYELRPRDFWATPLKAALPLIPHLESGCRFYEPSGDLIDHLVAHGMVRVGASDIEPRRDDITHRDAMTLTAGDLNGAEIFISNLPHSKTSWRLTLALLLRLSALLPIWTVLPADFAHNLYAGPILASCDRIQSIGRVRWITGSTKDGFENSSWFRFDARHSDGPRFFPRLEKQRTPSRLPRPSSSRPSPQSPPTSSIARRIDMSPKPKPKSAATPVHHDPETGEVVTPRGGMPKPSQPLFHTPEPAPPTEPDPVKDAAKEAPPQQPARHGWSLGGGSPEWGPLDLTGGGDKLPPPGNYDAVISDVQLIDKPDRLRMIVSFQLDGLEASPAPKWALIASRNGPSDRHELAEGARVVRRLAAATLTPLETIEAIKDPFELPSLFIGKPVNLTVTLKPRDGVLELEVRTMRPR